MSAARLTCGQAPTQPLSAQLRAKREDLSRSWRFFVCVSGNCGAQDCPQIAPGYSRCWLWLARRRCSTADTLRAKKGRRSVSWAGNRYGVGRGYTSRKPGLGQVAVWLMAAARVGACGKMHGCGGSAARPLSQESALAAGLLAIHAPDVLNGYIEEMRGDGGIPPARADRASSMPALIASACRAAYSSIT